VILVRVSFLKEIFYQAQNGTVRDNISKKCERITKMAFTHFKQDRLEPINFDLVQCNDWDL
jgi:hypothetical protein